MRVLDSIDEQAIDELLGRDEFFWLDLRGAGDEQLERLAQRLGWHPLVLEDTQHFGQRPKLDRFGDQMLLVFYGAEAEEPIEVHVLVSGSWVVTVRRAPISALEQLHTRMAEEETPNEEFVVYRVLDTLTDTFFPLLERIDDAIDELEAAIAQGPDDEDLQQVFQLKRRLVALRRVVAPQRDMAARTMEEIGDLPGLDPGTRDYFRDVYDHLIRVSDTVDAYRDLLTSVMDVYLSTVSNRLNAIMKQLTLISTIFLPITALTGFFGMNFRWLVSHVDTFWAFLALGVGGSVASCLILLLWFRRERFLD
jgi:magnesium transporter